MSLNPVDATVPVDSTEAGSLASELAHAYARMVTFYRDQLQMSGSEADAHAGSERFAGRSRGRPDPRPRASARSGVLVRPDPGCGP